MRTTLDQIESRLQAMIESSAALLGFGLHPFTLAHELVQAMQEHLQDDGIPGRYRSANQFTIFLHPSAIPRLRTGLLDDLAIALQDAAQDYGIRFINPPTIRLAPDPRLQPDEFHIQAEEQQDFSGGTAAVTLNKTPTIREPADPLPVNAFLIINGSHFFPLNIPVVNIGRRSDNQLILEDARVSRTHAQLRSVRGRYILFDLNSTGGTFVNGQRITQQTLFAGDVISLSGVALIYGEDASSPATPNLGDTAEISPTEGDPENK
jgi:pSer/pThr/pTyr-binding forkhead associated (FHA) protein